MSTITAPTPGATPAVGVRERRRARAAPLALVFAALLFIFPSEVALAGPLRSNGSPARLVGMVAMVLLLLDLLRARRSRQAVAPATVVLVLVYLVHALFSYGWMTLHGQHDPAGLLRVLLFAVSACGIALYAAVRVTTVDGVQRVVGVLIAGCSLSSVVAVTQAVGSPVRWGTLVTLPGFVQVAGISGGDARLGFRRVLGTASHPIEFGVVLACALPLAVHLFRHGGSRRSRQGAALAAVLMATALPFALSRGGLVCIAVAVLVFLVVQPWTVRAGMALLGAAAVCASFVLAPNLFSALVRLFADDATDPSIAGRTSDYPIVDAAFNASPWLGGAPMPPGLILDNQWLADLTARGLVGVAVFAALFALPVAGLLATAWRVRATDPRRQSLAAALAGALCALAVSGGVFDLMAFGQAAMLVFLLVGLSASVVLPPSPVGAGRGSGQEPARSASTGSPEAAMTLPSPSGTLRGVSTAP